MGNTFGIIDNDVLSFYENGVEYMVASTTMEKLEMIRMAQSLRIEEPK